jgi:hypothetical protein
MTIAKKLDLVGGQEVRRSDGVGVAPNYQAVARFSMERGIRIINPIQGFFLYIREGYQQLRR